jgi:mono/diheme cytochrome c family protein
MTTFEILKKTHFAVVIIFFLIYLIKTVLLLVNKSEALQSFTKKVKVLEMIVSVLFLITGVYLMIQLPEIKPMLIIKITMVFLAIPLAIVGFKKGNKGLAVLSFVLICGAFYIGERMKKQDAKQPEKAANADGTINGQEFYMANCESCHGDNGKKGAVGAFDLSITQLSNDSISSIILNGRNTMQKINGLTPEQAKAIAEYVGTNIKGK